MRIRIQHLRSMRIWIQFWIQIQGFYSIFVGHFCPPGSGSTLNADPDPADQINADPC
jgi:hypothetical protein